jgi:hypothetical protein
LALNLYYQQNLDLNQLKFRELNLAQVGQEIPEIFTNLNAESKFIK